MVFQQNSRRLKDFELFMTGLRVDLILPLFRIIETCVLPCFTWCCQAAHATRVASSIYRRQPSIIPMYID